MKRTYKMTPAQRFRAIQRYRKGEPLKNIAADYGVVTSSISELARRHGEPHRRPWKREIRAV